MHLIKCRKIIPDRPDPFSRMKRINHLQWPIKSSGDYKKCERNFIRQAFFTTHNFLQDILMKTRTINFARSPRHTLLFLDFDFILYNHMARIHGMRNHLKIWVWCSVKQRFAWEKNVTMAFCTLRKLSDFVLHNKKEPTTNLWWMGTNVLECVGYYRYGVKIGEQLLWRLLYVWFGWNYIHKY